MSHCLCGPRSLHRGLERIHVGHVQEHCHSRRVRWIYEGSDVGDPKRTEELFALRRGKPVILVFHVVMTDHSTHRGSFADGGLCTRPVCGSYARGTRAAVAPDETSCLLY